MDEGMTVEVEALEESMGVECDYCSDQAWIVLIRERTAEGMKRCCWKHSSRGLADLL